jgi:transposase
MMPRPTDHSAKAGVLASYASGLSGVAAAQAHGVSTSTAHGWILAAGISRSNGEAKRLAARQRYDAEYGLPGTGRWVPNGRGIVVWGAA